MSAVPEGNDRSALLSRLTAGGRLPHALILEGPADSGKTELAFALARAAVCLAEGEKPCGRCAGCVKALAGSHPDIAVLDGDADARAFPIDAIRKIRADAYIRPNEAPNRVFVLLGAHNMAEGSQNALLKVLEEPPEHVVFLLTAGSAAALLPTVRSRAQVVSLEGSYAADGADPELTARFAAAVTAKNEADLLFLTGELIRDRETFRAVLARLELVFRDALALRCGGSVCLSGQRETAQVLAGALTKERLLRLPPEVQKAKRALEQNANAALLATALCAGLREAAGR